MKEEIKVSNKERNNPSFHTSEVVILLLLTCMVSLLMGSVVTRSFSKQEVENPSSEAKKLIDQYQYIIDNYAGEIDEETLLEGAVAGMLDVLGDPYANLMDTTSTTSKEIKGSYTGLGLQVTADIDGNVEVNEVFENGPAGRAGIQKGDMILSVDGTNYHSANDFSTYVAAGTLDHEYEVKVKREEKELTFTLKKEIITIPSVSTEIFDDGKKIGYMNISIFSGTTYQQFEEQLSKLETEKIEGLILDVRGNSGGRLDAVVNILSTFLDSTHVIYQTDTKGEIEKFYSKGSETKSYPLVVLIDHDSASASEILAATLQEEYGATLVGKTTYGKGTVQQVKTLGNDIEYKLTTKKWLTPNGTWIHGKGVTPDVEVELDESYYEAPSHATDHQLQTAISLLKG